MLKARITGERRAIIARRLMKYITSPQFKNPIEEVIHIASELQDMIKEEAKSHIRVWKRRWDHYQTIHWDSSQLQDNIQLVLHGKGPKTMIIRRLPRFNCLLLINRPEIMRALEGRGIASGSGWTDKCLPKGL